ncbi:amidase domain-containing protein [Oscillospiraceae bacterium OttesenSCG-928-F05]|nr:amidase domain-containing protein [Oscillospiraceae bacterium OttesenSCG-928-F05]
MKRIRFISLSLALMMFLSLTTFGVEINYDINEVGDTLTYSVQEYEAEATKVALTKEGNIKNVISAFLTMSRARSRALEKYSPTALLDKSAATDKSVQYRLQESEYFYELYDALGATILWDNLVLDRYQVKIDGISAVASVVETYKYFDDYYQKEFGRVREYTFELGLDGNRWLIKTVKTNDPWETEDFDYDLINISESVNDAINPPDNSINDTIALKTETENAQRQAAQLTRGTQRTYNRTSAVSYAVAYYSNHNGSFPSNEPKDCQNFASQCVWFGLGGTNNNYGSTPMVSSNTAYRWYPGQYYAGTWHSQASSNSWAWDNANGFTRLINDSSVNGTGPYGFVHQKSVLNAAKGDVLQIDWGGNATWSYSSPNLDHAMVITDVLNNTATLANIQVAAHSSQTNSAYQPVINYTQHSSLNSYVICRVTCGYY